jgi:hypothetical protein
LLTATLNKYGVFRGERPRKCSVNLTAATRNWHVRTSIAPDLIDYADQKGVPRTPEDSFALCKLP